MVPALLRELQANELVVHYRRQNHRISGCSVGNLVVSDWLVTGEWFGRTSLVVLSVTMVSIRLFIYTSIFIYRYIYIYIACMHAIRMHAVRLLFDDGEDSS